MNLMKLYKALAQAINDQDHDTIKSLVSEILDGFEGRVFSCVGWQKPKLTGVPETDTELIKLDPYFTGDRPLW